MQTCEDDSEDSESDIILPSNFVLSETKEKPKKNGMEDSGIEHIEEGLTNFKRAKKPPRLAK